MASADYNRPNNSLNWILAGALILIGVFTISALVIMKSKTDQNTNANVNISNTGPTISVSPVINKEGPTDFTTHLGSSPGMVNSPFALDNTYYINFKTTDPQNDADTTYLDVKTVNVVIYKDGTSGAEACTKDLDNCYTDAVCTTTNGSGTTAEHSCVVSDMVYFAEPGTWHIYARVVDNADAEITDSNVTFTNTDVVSATVPSGIDFGNMAVGASKIDVTAVATNGGNVTLDSTVSATGWTCTVGTMAASVMKHKDAAFTTDYDDAAAVAYSGTAADSGMSLVKEDSGSGPKTFTLYNGLKIIPTGSGVSGVCTATITWAISGP